MLQLSATKCSCIAILLVSLVSFATITFCVASQRVFIIVVAYFFMTQSGNFWIHTHLSSSAAMTHEEYVTPTGGPVSNGTHVTVALSWTCAPVCCEISRTAGDESCSCLCVYLSAQFTSVTVSLLQ
jgi:hypothetical protein